MSFTSFPFLLFFPLVCVGYYLLRPAKLRILFLLIASYYFYLCWKPEFAVILFTNTLLTYIIGLLLNRTLHKKSLLVLGIILNVGVLFTYKYLGFFSDTISELFSMCGVQMNIPHLDLLLPIGISFFTFQLIAYLVDIYRAKIKPERNIISFALFISLFTKIAQGPIERADNLLTQISKLGGVN